MFSFFVALICAYSKRVSDAFKRSPMHKDSICFPDEGRPEARLIVSPTAPFGLESDF